MLTPPLTGIQELADLNPDFIFFDLNSPSSSAAFSLLESRPEVTLIGLSPDKNYARVWSGKQLRELSTQDLLKTISGNTEDISNANDT
jgi:hypothetical protein